MRGMALAVEEIGIVPGRNVLAAQARAQTGLDDFGDTWFFANIDALIPSLNDEARLSPAGAATARAMIVNGLVNRLRHVDLVKRHPEILDERVEVAAVLVGLPRTGGAMLHRLLASLPGMTGARWFETQNYAPLPGEARGRPDQRRQAAEAFLAYMHERIPGLPAVHPMSVDQPDDEQAILGQLYSGMMIEGAYHVPGFARWLGGRDRARCYRDLREILQSLQWQEPARKGARWVLKTAGHLMALDAVLAVFPGARIVMTHRDPVATVPAYCGMEYSLYRMVSDTIDRASVARFWVPRLAGLLGDYGKARAADGGRRFIDVLHADLLRDPVGRGTRVLERVGIALTAPVRAAMEAWADEEAGRGERMPSASAPEAFGLDEAEIGQAFAAYRAAFL